jgi:two-component system, sensor histidine kinase and response regulator
MGTPWQDEEHTSQASSSSLNHDQRSLHILLAEDNEVNQKLGVRTLEKIGHTVVVADNGREALSALERETFDLILMDIQMPEMDGFEATAAIREKEKSTGVRIPLIAMTAHAMKGDRERCLDAGMDEYISKPINAATLFAVIDNVAATPAAIAADMPAQESQDDIMDMEEVMERVGDDMELLTDMAELFLDDCPRLMSEIRESITRQDSKVLEHSAHTLKGSASNFSAASVVEAAFRLEQMGRDGDITHAEAAYATLEQEMQRLEPVLMMFGKRDTQ